LKFFSSKYKLKVDNFYPKCEWMTSFGEVGGKPKGFFGRGIGGVSPITPWNHVLVTSSKLDSLFWKYVFNFTATASSVFENFKWKRKRHSFSSFWVTFQCCWVIFLLNDQ
jgi:hypothetical protein